LRFLPQTHNKIFVQNSGLLSETESIAAPIKKFRYKPQRINVVLVLEGE